MGLAKRWEHLQRGDFVVGDNTNNGGMHSNEKLEANKHSAPLPLRSKTR
ncbi:MAG TPA: hypothetical protein PK850_04835 [Ignavibacteria bacterium]|nr:hypothetical protein [Ignavibacteria bacterium]